MNHLSERFSKFAWVTAGAMLAAAVALTCGCSSSANPSAGPLTGIPNTTSASSSSATTVASEASRTIPVDELGSGSGGIYALSSDGKSARYPLDNSAKLVKNYSSIASSSNDPIASNDKKAGSLFTGQKNGDSWAGSISVDLAAGEKLILTGDFASEPSLSFSKVFDNGYWQGEDVNGNPSGYDEIGGHNVEDAGMADGSHVNYDACELVLSNKHVYFRSIIGSDNRATAMATSDTPTKLSASWYENTTYKEGSIPIVYPYYLAQADARLGSSAVEKTKNGYFILDISSLDSGSYCVVASEGQSTTSFIVKVSK